MEGLKEPADLHKGFATFSGVMKCRKLDPDWKYMKRYGMLENVLSVKEREENCI